MLTLLIIVITSIISIIAFSNPGFFYRFDFQPYRVKENNEWWRFITHAFLHGDWMHLIINMFVLFFFGSAVESYLDHYLGDKGWFFFLLIYFGGLAFAVLPTLKKHSHNPNYHSVGASGAVSAVLFSSVIFSPATSICLYGILCLPGIVWAVVYLGYSYYMSKKEGDFINHDAHFWGAIFGVAFTFIAVPASFAAFFKQLGELLAF